MESEQVRAGRAQSLARRLRVRRAVGLAALAYIVAIGLARVVGFARESVVAYLFGASRETDSYLAATALPEFVAGILLSGVVGYMVIPAFVRFEHEGRKQEARDLLAVAFACVLLVSAAIAAVAAIFAPAAMHLLAPGLARASHADALRMLRITSPAIVLFAVAGFAGAVLNARNRFLPIPVSLLAGNALAVAVLLVFRHVGIDAAAFAYLAASATTAVVQFAVLRRAGLSIPLTFRRPTPSTLHALLAGGTAVVAVSTAYARPFIERGLASTLRTGDIAAIGFATKLLLLAGALVAVPVGTLSFPALAGHAAASDRSEFRRTLRRALGAVTLFAIISSALLIVAARPIVNVAFRHGAFGDIGAARTARVLSIYAAALIPICAAEVVVRALLALRRERAVLLIWSGTLALTIALDVALLGRWGVSALAVGGAIGLWVNLVTMLVCVRRWIV